MNIGFLMVGHTHEDVDQMFSCFSNFLSGYMEPVISVEKLIELVTKVYVPSPAAFYLTHLFDWKSVLDNHSAHKTKPDHMLHGHAGEAHQYRFRRDPSEPRRAAKLTWKEWGVDKEWCPVSEDIRPVYLLHTKVDLSSLRMLPLCGPKGDAASQLTIIKDNYTMLKNIVKVCPASEAYQIQELETTMNKWFGVDKNLEPISPERLAELRPVMIFEDIPVEQKWEIVIAPLGDGDGDGEGDTDADDDMPVLQTDVVVERDKLIYQGKLNSRNRNALTNAGNFVDLTLLAVGNLVIVRNLSEDDENQFCLCKINSIRHEERLLDITWWGNRNGTISGTQFELQKANDVGSSKKGQKAKNIPYKDTVHFDSVLVAEPVTLTSKKHVPKKFTGMASRRIGAAIKIMQQRKKTQKQNKTPQLQQEMLPVAIPAPYTQQSLPPLPRV